MGESKKERSFHLPEENDRELSVSRQGKQERFSEYYTMGNVHQLGDCYVKLEKLSDDFIKSMTEEKNGEDDLLRLVRVSPERQETKARKRICWFRCSKCPYRTRIKEYFLIHKQKINYQCGICDFKANLMCVKAQHYNLHKRSKIGLESHYGAPLYFCDFCRYFCKDRNQLVIHIYNHKHGIFDRTYSCSCCNFRADSRPKLKQHYVYTHGILSENVRFASDEISISPLDSVVQTPYERKIEGKPEVIKVKFNDNIVIMRINHVLVKNKSLVNKKEVVINLEEKEINTNTKVVEMKEISDFVGSMPNGSSEEKTMFQCKHCPFKTPHLKAFICHTVSIYFECPKCDFTTTVRCEILSHTNNHLDQMRFLCKKCNYVAPSAISLHNHKKLHELNLETMVFVCGVCSFLCTKREVLLKHSKEEHELNRSKADNYKCGYCQYETASTDTLIDHYLQVHNVVKHKDERNVTQKRISVGDIIDSNKHQKKLQNTSVNKEDTRRRYNCDYCDFSTINKWKFNKHNIIRHKKILAKVYKCSMCTFHTVNQLAMEKHQKKHRTKRLPATFKCNLCNFKSEDKASIEVHLTKHKKVEELKIYKCDKCSFETIFKNHLASHRKLHDSMEDDDDSVFKCLKCDFQTDKQLTLISHNFTHILAKT